MHDLSIREKTCAKIELSTILKSAKSRKTVPERPDRPHNRQTCFILPLKATHRQQTFHFNRSDKQARHRLMPQ